MARARININRMGAVHGALERAILKHRTAGGGFNPAFSANVYRHRNGRITAKVAFEEDDSMTILYYRNTADGPAKLWDGDYSELAHIALLFIEENWIKEA